ncbi:MAG: amino acid adenylation domain-containing protein [Rhizobiales bacterium]|nr:amino acid adenylation domain-containing protein [Hyphomicrobiales bacterium]
MRQQPTEFRPSVPRPVQLRRTGKRARLSTSRFETQILSGDSEDFPFQMQEGERLNHLIEKACDRFRDSDAVVTDDAAYSYGELDCRANQVARYLTEQGIKAGDRVGLLFDRTVETYVAMLAVMKVNAAYVPLDTGFPTERIRFIAGDASLAAIVSMAAFDERLGSLELPLIYLDAAKRDIDMKPSGPLGREEVAPIVDQACYVLYTSGTTGNPKGVLIEHPSICNFVQVAADRYGYEAGDRVYQGMTIAFDFSIEEIWVPLLVGATLIPGKPGVVLMGDELADFLESRDVTCMACCPTLLATIERDLPKIRFLLVGGEACPQSLVLRWYSPKRTILNSYGPTETTVTATVTELTPKKQVTIGRPLPNYTIVILDPVKAELMPFGEQGEIGIAGIGLAAGYLNRADLTAQKFIPDFVGLPNNPSQRIYRTGDLGRITPDGEVEYFGRIDTQVKIRGHRIELAEIESVLMGLPQVSQAAVTTFEPEPGIVELVGYYALKQGVSELSLNDILQTLRARLPAYMVPAFLEKLPFIPMSISNKADLKNLPKPKGSRVQSGKTIVAATNDTERAIAGALAAALKLDAVSIEDHFFNDLGANSLLMARFCANVRKSCPTAAALSMQDIYLHPTVAQLAAHLGQSDAESAPVMVEEPLHVPSDLSYYGCGALQLLSYCGYGMVSLWLFILGFDWMYAAIDNPVSFYLRSTVFVVAAFALAAALPVAAKWLLIGRWKEERFPIWSLRYFRFWVVKTLVRTSPVGAFVGTPIFNIYLRLLGAKIGRNTVILSRLVPVCTDLFTVGDNTVLRDDSMLPGYRARSNYIETGRVDIGSYAFVGAASVLDIDTAMGDRTQLGHASSLQSGQRIPDGKHYHGSPAVETATDYCPLEMQDCSSRRRTLYAAGQLAGLLLVATPLMTAIGCYWYEYFTQFGAETIASFALPTPVLIGLTLIAATVLLAGALAAGLLRIYVVPRLCNLFLEPGKVYPLFGFHYGLQNIISAASNVRFFNLLFGDSSAIVHYMQFVGWNLGKVEQTGSNFGTNQNHDNPFLCEIGGGTMVSDGLSMMNIDISNASFRLAKARIGERNYLGNDIHYPPQGRTGDNVLLGTKVMIPVDGPVRENVGLLGSPCFEIPRMVERDQQINAALSEEERHDAIRRKNRYNLATGILFLLARLAFVFSALLIAHVAMLNYQSFGILSLFAAGAILTILSVVFFALLERASLGFKRLTPKIVSIYDPYFWWHERHWKLSDTPIIGHFGGTPFKNLISRMVGLQVGRKVYDGGCSITDRSLTEIGDYVNLNEGSVLQAHSLEEGVLKSDYIRVGEGGTLGCGAFVHYGVVMGERAVIDPDSFVMKGEVIDPQTQWRGNPAKMLRRPLVRTPVQTGSGKPLEPMVDYVQRIAAE